MKSAYLLSLLAVGLVACSSTRTTLVQVPPRMALDRNQTLGIVRFDVEGGRGHGEEPNVTAKFIEAIQHGQPGVPIVELGSSSEVLSGVGKSQLNAEALQEIGKKYNVDAVIVGSVQLKESKPKVNVNLAQGISLSSLQAQVRLDGHLEAKIVTTARGASVWTGTSARWINLVQASGSMIGIGSLNVPDRDRQYENLIADMVNDASRDFYPTCERQVVAVK
jgi:TolB-like protein